jgi:hypothetical protein
MCSMPIAVKTPTGPIVAHVLLLVRGCASWHRNRVLQSAEPKEAVVQRESLEFMSHEATEMRFAVSGTIWIKSSAESAVVALSHTWHTGEQLTWGRKYRRAVAETRVRGPHPGAPMDQSSSPGARPTGVSVAALSSPTRTARAMSRQRPPSLAPSLNEKRVTAY